MVKRHVRFLGIPILGLLALAACGKGPGVGDPLPANAFQAEIVFKAPPAVLKSGTPVFLDVNVRNASAVPWPADGNSGQPQSINLSYHWFAMDGKVAVFDGSRTALPHGVAPGAEVTLRAQVTPPPQPGDYVLEADLVQESVAWFSNKGSKTARANVKVE